MHLNIKNIRDYTGADDAFISKLFDKFLDHIHTDISKLQKETEARNWNAVKSVSHAMLSSARIFSLDQLIPLHEKIETDCNNNSTENIPAMVAEVSILYNEVVSEMNELKEKS